MDLKKFITQSLVEIMTGLKDAQDQLRGSHARICPTLSDAITPGGQQTLIGRSTKGQAIALVEYDIAVEASNEAGGGGEIKVLGGLIGAGVEGKKSKAEKIASRIKFSVPVAYPDVAD
jgi:hypothetical protein